MLLVMDALMLPKFALWPLMVLCVAMEALAISMISPLNSSLLFVNADPDDRARVIGMVYATIALMVCIFPTIIGVLADISLYLPFFINIALFIAMGVCVVLISRMPVPEEQ